MEAGIPHEIDGELPGAKEYRQIYEHTVPIIDYDRSRPDQVGSGVFIAVDERKFVVTAAHVLEPGFQKVGFGYLDDQGFHVFGSPGVPILTAQAQSGCGNPQTAVYKDELDLAIIEPDAQTLDAIQEHYRPFALRRCSLDPRARSGVVAGWPSRKTNITLTNGDTNSILAITFSVRF